MPWVDKYRPQKLSNIMHQVEITENLKNIVKSGKMPHLLLHGPSGTGKTSAILALATELFGPKKMKERVIELNASDERGINVVRHKMMNFVKSVIGNSDENYLCPDYKIIILDEADAMTNEAQSALRKMIETYSHITRFCFICNYINQLIEPVVSRCVKMEFTSVNDESIIERLNYISKQENFSVHPTYIQNIAKISHGDMRKSILMFQHLKYVMETKIKYKKNDYNIDYNIFYDDKIIKDISNMISDDYVKQIIDVCTKNKTIDILNIAQEIKYGGYAATLLIKQIQDYLIHCTILNDKQKGLVTIQILQIDKMLINGANEYLQILHLLLFIKCVHDNTIYENKIYQYQ